ncbi:uncharacterized protein L199_002390 [Kwoniella botswanensis]|uniref:uncharacterized protein n=1 Tax=Kwoniella botswanensis TaxID=1268659 RepID=UPI00315CF89B
MTFFGSSHLGGFRQCLLTKRPKLKTILEHTHHNTQEEVWYCDNLVQSCKELLSERRTQNRLGNQRTALLRELALLQNHDIQLFKIDFLDWRKKDGRPSTHRIMNDAYLFADYAAWDQKVCEEKKCLIRNEVERLRLGNEGLLKDSSFIEKMIDLIRTRSSSSHSIREHTSGINGREWLMKNGDSGLTLHYAAARIMECYSGNCDQEDVEIDEDGHLTIGFIQAGAESELEQGEDKE